MKTRDLQKLWWDWLSTSERLLRSLYEQTAALTLRDVARVERIQPELDGLMALMQSIDEQAAVSARKLAEEAGVEPNLRSLVGTLEKAEAQQVQSVANRVMVAARNVQKVLDKNRALIDSELVYTSGTLALIAKAASESQGPFASESRAAVLVDNVA